MSTKISNPLDDLLASKSLESATFTRKQLADLIARARAEGAAMAGHIPADEKAARLMPDWLSFDPVNDALKIHGITYAVDLFKEFDSTLPIGVPFEIVARDNGTIAVHRLDSPAAADAAALSAALKEICEMQRQNYGDGMATHLALIDLTAKARLLLARPAAVMAEARTDVSDMVNRFLGWKLPQDFRPDAGISFDPAYADKWGGYPQGYPIGTNLLTADQAKAMFLHCLGGVK